jgi:hypothetical protein
MRFAYARGVSTERRVADRRYGDRRSTPGASMDVSRIEHENLYRQVEEVMRILQRIEKELEGNRRRIETVERDVQAILLTQSKGA